MFSKSCPAHASRRWLVLVFAVLAVGVAGCGSSSSGTTSSSSEPPAAAAKEESGQETKNGIPQGEHAGDGDGDNHGEPSDGDGDI